MTTRRAVAQEMRGRAANGEWASGQSMPTVAQLMETYSVSAATAVRAMHDLCDEGLVERLHGVGYRRTSTPANADRDAILQQLRIAEAALRKARLALERNYQ